MASLASKDSYLQKLASKVCAQQQEPRNRPFVPFQGGRVAGPPKKRNKTNHKQISVNSNIAKHQKLPLKPNKKLVITPAQRAPGVAEQVSKATVPNGVVVETKQKPKGEKPGTKFSTVDILRQRLHEKIEESRGQGTPKDPSSEEVQKKREKRKQERERKKRKRKEFLIKKLAEKAGLEYEPEIKREEAPPPPTAPAAGKRDETAIVFNKVELGDGGFLDKEQKKKEKKNRIKGGLTPLVGKNYKQLLGRVEARKAKLEELREKDEGKAKVQEEKMKWTNVLYKAEGLKIKDDEDLLRASLKRKEKMRSQRKKKWTDRSETVVEKMQRRQDKRRRNIQKNNKGKVEKKKDRARKRGRVLPEDLKKAQV
ncbi:surfeit locus protein 6 [Salvelinus alpinus]|uniref:surfeit locus protein 6 n=1 Tax=Salvelinus alpinus TaxID=8036 RepID=UPI0039FBA4D0